MLDRNGTEDSFWANIFRPSAESETRRLLRRVPILAGLDRRELDAVEKILYRREYHADEVVFRQGEPGLGMFVIERGTVAIVHEPTERVLAELEDGDFFGEIALLNEMPRSATAVARTTATLWGLFQPELFDLFERNPRLASRLLLPLAQTVGDRLVAMNRRLLGLHDANQALRAALQRASGPADPPEAMVAEAGPLANTGSALDVEPLDGPAARAQAE